MMGKKQMARGMMILLALVGMLPVKAQYNTDRLMTSGEIALHYEDYVLSIQYFNQVISFKILQRQRLQNEIRISKRYY